MLDAIGQPRACPICNSSDVRWRGRRFYDVPLNWLRYVVEYCLQVFTNSRRQTYYVAPPGSMRDAPARYHYEQHRQALDERASTMTPRAFWRCRSCGNRGQIFDEIDGIERLDELEEQVIEQGGVVGDPKNIDLHPR
jgi:hypothetical protein